MSAILEQLYYGKVSNADAAFSKALERKDFKQLLDSQAQLAEQLEAVLTKQQIIQFHTYCKLQEESAKIEHEEVFAYAFQLGAKVMAEILSPQEHSQPEEAE